MPTDDAYREFKEALALINEPLARYQLDTHHSTDPQRPWEGECASPLHADDQRPVPWPCPTIRAIAEHFEVPVPGR